MRIKLISRNDEEYTRETTTETNKETYSESPNLHRFEKPREYIRALNSTKYGKWFSRPFVTAVSEHSDTPSKIELSRKELNVVLSGSCDGELILWNISNKKKLWAEKNVFDGFVNGLKIEKSSKRFFCCGGNYNGGLLKVYNLDSSLPKKTKMIKVYKTKSSTLLCLDISEDQNTIATGGTKIVVWDTNKFVPKQQFTPSFDEISSLAFNKVEKSVFAASTNDNRICIFDLKSGSIVQKFEMMRRSNSICWNPMRPFLFSIGSDDSNCYTFDFRKLTKGPVLMHTGHTGSVQALDYSPAGQEFVSGSFDNTVRIFRVDDTHVHAREVYHTQRMHKVWCVKYSLDGKYIYSGSDDHSIRVWKTQADEPMRVTSKFEKKKLNYHKALINRYKDFSEIRRIHDFKRVPSKIRSENKKRKHQISKMKRQEQKVLKKKEKFVKNQWQRDVERTFRGVQKDDEIYSDDEEL